MALAVEDQIALNGSHPTLGHVQAQISAAQRLLAAHTVAQEFPQLTPPLPLPPVAPRPNIWKPDNPLLPGPMLDFPPGTRLTPDGVPYGQNDHNPQIYGPGRYQGKPGNPFYGTTGNGVLPYIVPAPDVNGGYRPRPEANNGYLFQRQDRYGPGGVLPFGNVAPVPQAPNPLVEAARRLLLAHRETVSPMALA